MELEPIEKTSVSDGIIDLIKKQILEGKIRPGEKLPSEEKMAEKLRVGRGTVREALKVLIYMGFIERKNKASIVSQNFQDKIFPKDFLERLKRSKNVMDMIEARLMIEPGVVRYAAIKAKSDDIEKLKVYCEEMERSIEDLEQFVTFNNRFHMHIVHASGNQIMIDIMHGIQGLMRKNQEFFVMNSKNIRDRSIAYHRNILSAIISGDPDLAEKQMVAHLKDVEKEMYMIFSKE